MNELSQAAQFATNILLFLGAIMGWIAYQKPEDLVADARLLAEEMLTSKKVPQDESISDILNDLRSSTGDLYSVRTLKIGQLRFLARGFPGIFGQPSTVISRAEEQYIDVQILQFEQKRKQRDGHLWAKALDQRRLQLKEQFRMRNALSENRGLVRIIELSDTAHIPDEATIAQAQQMLESKIKIPILDEYVPRRVACALLVIGWLFGIAYLSSLVRSIADFLLIERPTIGQPWIWFHPGFLGLFLGIASLSAPALAAVAALFYTYPRGVSWSGASLVALTTIFSLLRAHRIRLLYLDHRRNALGELASGETW